MRQSEIVHVGPQIRTRTVQREGESKVATVPSYVPRPGDVLIAGLKSALSCASYCSRAIGFDR